MNPLDVRFPLLLPVLVVLLVIPADAQLGGGNRVKLSGTVFSAVANESIAQAEVRLCDPGGNLIEQGWTNDSGEFGFRDIERGRYVLTVDAVGYQREYVQLDLSFMSEKGIAIQLKPAKKDLPDPAASGVTVSAHELSMPREARALVSSGRTQLYIQKNPAASLESFTQALMKAPGYYEAHYEIGMAQVQLGRIEDAEKSFRKAIEVSGDTYGGSEIALGTLLIEKGSPSEGEKALERGVELDPHSWMGYFELGKLELSQNRLDDARKSAEQARSLAPSTPMTYRLLANIHLQMKDYSAVLQDIDAYVKLDPDSPAGVRAREMREEIMRKTAGQNAMPTSSK
jgi:tetratricopeptide (TPR) repeat protein